MNEERTKEKKILVMDFPVLLHVPIFSPRLLKCSHDAQLYFFSYHKLSNADVF